MTATITSRPTAQARTASIAGDALAATELVRRASAYVQAIVLANLAARHPEEAELMLEAAEDAQEAILDVWATEDIAEPGPGMFPAVAMPRRPDAIATTRAALEEARAQLSAAMDLPTPDAELQELRERVETAEDAWHTDVAVYGRFCH